MYKRQEHNYAYVVSHRFDQSVFIYVFAVLALNNFEALFRIQAVEFYLAVYGIFIGREVEVIHQDLISLFGRMIESSYSLMYVYGRIGADGNFVRICSDKRCDESSQSILIEEISSLRPHVYACLFPVLHSLFNIFFSVF